MKTAIVIGGGISGLAAAWQLERLGVDVTVLELRDEPGGVMLGETQNGFRVELGPSEMMLKNEAMEELLTQMGLKEQLQWQGPEAQKRYIVRNGKPVALPQSLLDGAFNPILSLSGKFSLAFEWTHPKGKLDDESVSHFVQRRIGKDFLDYAVGPLCSGIYAGDPERLSMRHAFPALWDLEVRYGGMVRGALGKMWERRKASGVPAYKRSLVSFKGGMCTLPRHLAAQLGERIHCSAKISSIEQASEGKSWSVSWQQNGQDFKKGVDKLILATPAYALEKLPLPESLLKALSPLKTLPYSPVTTVFSGYRSQDVAHPLDGFGVLVPRKETRGVIGTLFLSSLFEGRAPKGHVALLSFVGGMYAREYAFMPPEEQKALVRAELKRLLGVTGEPVVEASHLWKEAIPNFPVGYQECLDTLDKVEERWKDLAIVGNYRGGPAAGDSLVKASMAAKRLMENEIQESKGASQKFAN